MFREVIEIDTETDEFVDITERIVSIVNNCQISEGLCHVFLPGTTAGFLINEHDRMLIEDFKRLFRKYAPEDGFYNHPSNAFSHIKASFLKSEFTFPVSNGSAYLGTWQNILLWEFDINNRKREILITIIGD